MKLPTTHDFKDATPRSNAGIVFHSSLSITTTSRQSPRLVLLILDACGHEHDVAEPLSNPVACGDLLRLASYSSRTDYNSKLVELFSSFEEILMRIPIAIPGLSCTLVHYWDTTIQIYIAGKRDAKGTEELLNRSRSFDACEINHIHRPRKH
ncbi:spermatogenesis-associated protein 20-like isoform X1 [Cotesia typhae]|uniref:spermatogenesis-associated protein 20-like isoform X1 n=1 Tax=Cotesia typhae TaxID=2053667 RepID=UPI003D698C56